MADMLPQEIAEQLGPSEYVRLCSYIEKKYKQAFGVISIRRTAEGIFITVELTDNTRHRIQL